MCDTGKYSAELASVMNEVLLVGKVAKLAAEIEASKVVLSDFGVCDDYSIGTEISSTQPDGDEGNPLQEGIMNELDQSRRRNLIMAMLEAWEEPEVQGDLEEVSFTVAILYAVRCK